MKILEKSIIELHKELTSKKISATELTHASLDAIDKHDHKLKAFITVCKKDALRVAKKVDEKIATGEKIGLLAGIPFSAKDVIMTEGIKTTAGSKMLENYVAPYNATVIARLKKAGAILIGKTNCDAYGHGSSTENSDFFVTKNPWDTSRVAGGSSGGAAAAVAMGMGVFALGEDTGGSIRQPAALCGVTGLKVSYGRVSRYGSIAYASSFDTIGPITKSASDVATVLRCIAGKDAHDHTTMPDIVPNYLQDLKKPFPKLKIGLPKEYFTSDLDPAIKEKIMEAVKEFEKMGCEVKKVSLPHTKYAIPTYYLLAPAETSANLARLDSIRYGHRAKNAKTIDDIFKKSRSEGFGKETKRRILIGTYALSAGYFDEYYKKAQKIRTLIREDFNKVFADVDVLFTPTSPFTAFPIGEKATDPLAMYLADIYTIAFSLAGLPTISVPCGFIKNLPVGMQITGRYMDETTVLHVAHQYESVTTKQAKKPNL